MYNGNQPYQQNVPQGGYHAPPQGYPQPVYQPQQQQQQPIFNVTVQQENISANPSPNPSPCPSPNTQTMQPVVRSPLSYARSYDPHTKT